MKKINIKEIRNLYYGKGYNVKDVAEKLNVSFWSLYNFMDKNNIPRRSYSEANYLVNKDKPRFKVRNDLSIHEQKLKIAGIM